MADNCLTKVMFNEILNLPHNQIDVPFRYIDNMKCIFESRDMDHMFIIQIMLTDIKINVDSHIFLFLYKTWTSSLCAVSGDDDNCFNEHLLLFINKTWTIHNNL